MKHMMAMLILTLLVSSIEAEIFRDDFNDGDLQGWTFVEGAEDSGIENGELVLGAPKAEVIIAVDDIIASDYEIAVSLKISEFWGDIDRGPSIGLRAHTDSLLELIIKSDPAQGQGEKIPLWLLYERSYKFFLGIDHLKRGLGATIRHMDWRANQRNNRFTVTLRDSLPAFRLFDFRLHKWYRLKIIAKGNRFQCFIDDTEMLDFFDDTYTEGAIYLSSGWGNRVHFDDFEVQYEVLAVQPRKQLTTTWGEIKGGFHTR